jgi:hypothetical protein
MYVLTSAQRAFDARRRRLRLLKLLRARKLYLSRRRRKSNRSVSSFPLSSGLSLPLMDAVSSLLTATASSVPKGVKKPLRDTYGFHSVPEEGVVPKSIKLSDKDVPVVPKRKLSSSTNFVNRRVVIHIWDYEEQSRYADMNRILKGDRTVFWSRVGAAFTGRNVNREWADVPVMTINNSRDVMPGGEVDSIYGRLHEITPLRGFPPGYYFIDYNSRQDPFFRGYAATFNDIPYDVAVSTDLIHGVHGHFIDAENGFALSAKDESHKVFSLGEYAPDIDQGLLLQQDDQAVVIPKKYDYNDYDTHPHDNKKQVSATSTANPVYETHAYRHHTGFRDDL